MGKIWYRKLPGNLVLVPENSQEFSTFWVVPVSVREKIGLGKKYQYRYWKNKKIVLERSTGTGKIWSRKKVSVPVPEKFGPGKKYRYRYQKN